MQHYRGCRISVLALTEIALWFISGPTCDEIEANRQKSMTGPALRYYPRRDPLLGEPVVRPVEREGLNAKECKPLIVFRSAVPQIHGAATEVVGQQG